jgi:hypothetical protein
VSIRHGNRGNPNATFISESGVCSASFASDWGDQQSARTACPPTTANLVGPFTRGLRPR